MQTYRRHATGESGRAARAAAQPADDQRQRASRPAAASAGRAARSSPLSASAKIDVRLVNGIDPAKQFERLVAHVRKQGYFVVETEPDAATRAAHPWLARVTRTGGYPAGRTSMDTPLAAAVAQALSDAAGGTARAAADDRRQHAVLSVRRRPRRADVRAVDRQLRQQPARTERKPADQESVGGHRLDGGAAHDAMRRGGQVGLVGLVGRKGRVGQSGSSGARSAGSGGSDRSGLARSAALSGPRHRSFHFSFCRKTSK